MTEGCEEKSFIFFAGPTCIIGNMTGDINLFLFKKTLHKCLVLDLIKMELKLFTD